MVSGSTRAFHAMAPIAATQRFAPRRFLRSDRAQHGLQSYGLGTAGASSRGATSNRPPDHREDASGSRASGESHGRIRFSAITTIESQPCGLRSAGGFEMMHATRSNMKRN